MASNNLESKLWAIADELRGKMDANEFKNYILGFVFYKYLSEKVEIRTNGILRNDNITFKEACLNKKYAETLKKTLINRYGYFISPEHLFSNIVNKCRQDAKILQDLEDALTEITESSMNQKSQEKFRGLFDDVDLTSSRLGKKENERNVLISRILLKLDEIDFQIENDEVDILGDAYEYLISQFASNAGKKAGEFYTPQQVSKILAKIVTLGKQKLKNVYDPTCGSGSLLLRVAKETEVDEVYGQELNQTTYNLARMNMILHDVRYDKFNITQGDTLEEPVFMDKKFEAVVANPPFSAKWSADEKFNKDERFGGYGKLAPRSKADYSFVQDMIYHLDEEGVMAVVLPHGVLFRGAAEDRIRTYLVDKKNYLDAVIGLPANIFYGTSIPTVILVFKKCRTTDEDVLFIDASKCFEKAKNQNVLKDEDVERIVNCYANRDEIDKFSHRATIEEIEENDFNLNIPRYVDTFEEEEPIDLDEVVDELEKIAKEMEDVDKEIKKYCDELGIRAPIF